MQGPRISWVPPRYGTNDGATWTNVSPSWGSNVYSAMSVTVYGEILYVGLPGSERLKYGRAW